MFLNDKSLNIETSGAVITYEDDKHQRYEPTPYYVIKELIKSGIFTTDSKILDCGSGKGRIAFALNNIFNCEVCGIEFSKELYLDALENLKNYNGEYKEKISFLNKDVIDYDFSSCNFDTFYFFNPFDLSTFKRVLNQLFKNPNARYIVFYYMDSDFYQFMRLHPEMKVIKTIFCTLTPNDFLGNRILILDLKAGKNNE